MAKIIPLKKSGMFGSLNDQELARFARIISEEKFEAGAVLVEGNAVSDRFLFIQKGKAVVKAPHLGEGVEATLGSGDTLGEWALLGPEHPCNVTAVAVEPANILVVRRDDFEQFSADHPATALKVQRDLLERVWESIRSVSGVLGVAAEGGDGTVDE